MLLLTTPEPNALYMGNASILPSRPKRYLYHAYLACMEANGYKNPLSMKMSGLSMDGILREYGLNYLKRRTKQGIQTNLVLTDDSNTDLLLKFKDSAAI